MTTICPHCGEEYNDLPLDLRNKTTCCFTCNRKFDIMMATECPLCGTANSPHKSKCRSCGRLMEVETGRSNTLQKSEITIKTRCTHCGQEYSLEPKLMNIQLSCSACKQNFISRTLTPVAPPLPLSGALNAPDKTEDFSVMELSPINKIWLNLFGFGGIMFVLLGILFPMLYRGEAVSNCTSPNPVIFTLLLIAAVPLVFNGIWAVIVATKLQKQYPVKVNQFNNILFIIYFVLAAIMAIVMIIRLPIAISSGNCDLKTIIVALLMILAFPGAIDTWKIYKANKEDETDEYE